VTIQDLCSLFNIKPRTYHLWRARYRDAFPPPRGHGMYARYDNSHVEALRAFLALRHNNIPATQAVAYCAETGISLTQFVAQRERAIREFGIGIA
jgi:DNA-binding transcriptional MerR regulator